MPRAPLVCLALLTTACGDPGGASDDTDEGPGGGTHDTDMGPVLGACAPEDPESDPFADCVDEVRLVGAGFGQDRLPEIVLGPPVPGTGASGGVDVLSLGCGGLVTLFFDGPGIPDGPGPDLIVFENPFPVGDATFVEPARVLVSDDGVDWRVFPCAPGRDDPPVGCAGIGRVRAGGETGIDPTDPEHAGGDAFDLAELGLSRARWVRLIDVGAAHEPTRMWCGGAGGGFDLDAVAAVHAP